MGTDWARKADLTVLPILRANLTSGVARKTTETELRQANNCANGDAGDVALSALAVDYAFGAGEAAEAAQYAGRAAAYTSEGHKAAVAYSSESTEAAHRATHSAVANGTSEGAYRGIAAYLTRAFWSEIRADALEIEDGNEPAVFPLWSAATPEWFKTNDATARKIWAKDPDIWSFWLRWWDGILAGRPLPDELQLKVALISEDTWKAGPAAVADAIRRIETDLALDATDNGERVEPNPETGLLRLVPGSALPEDIAVYARRKIEKAIALVDAQSFQQYGSLSADLAMLMSAVDDASNLPMELFDSCVSASRRLATRVANGECPPVEKDAVLNDYRSRLREVAADILAHDPQTQAVLERRNRIVGNDALIVAADVVTGAAAQVVPITEGALATALPRDAALSTNPQADAEDRKDATYRLAGRLLRIGKWVTLGVGGTGAAIIGSKEVLEAIPAIQASPLFQQALSAILRWLGLG
ncbi:MAG: hypothetical protein MUE52_03490 [Tabrizicola sp.]|nr:hypothetical protein [Tabrizicola sp.]